MRTLLSMVAATCTALGLAPSPTETRSAGRSALAARAANAAQAAQNLPLTSTVRTALIDAAASSYGLAASDFVGLGAARTPTPPITRTTPPHRPTGPGRALSPIRVRTRRESWSKTTVPT